MKLGKTLSLREGFFLRNLKRVAGKAHQRYFSPFATLLNIIILSFLICLSPIKLCFADEAKITPDIIENIKVKYKGDKLKRMVAWQKLIEENSRKPENTKLELVNHFFNQFEYRSDAQQIGRVDYWMTPIEFIDRGGGDCEDYTIAKYFTLQAMGVPRVKMRITYVKYLKQGIAHMVLTYYATPRSMPLVLDNLISAIKSAEERTDLKPVYSFNGDGLWLARQRGQGRRVSGSDRLSLWEDLNKRMLEQTQ